MRESESVRERGDGRGAGGDAMGARLMCFVGGSSCSLVGARWERGCREVVGGVDVSVDKKCRWRAVLRNTRRCRSTNNVIRAQFFIPPDEQQKRMNRRAARNVGEFTKTVVGQAVLWGGLVYLVASGNLGWIFDSVFLLIGLSLVSPLVAVLVLRFWLKRNVVQGECANCGFPQAARKKGPPFPCIACGKSIVPGESGVFELEFAKDVTVDVSAVDVIDVEKE